MQRAYRESTRLLAALLVLLGVAIIVAAIVRGAGPLSVGVVLGLLFALLGIGRLVLSRAPRRRTVAQAEVRQQGEQA